MVYDEWVELHFFPIRITFKNYSADTLMLIFEKTLKDCGRELENDARPLVEKVISHDIKDRKDSFGNASYVKDELLPKLIEAQLKRKKEDYVCRVIDVEHAFADKLTG